MNFVLNVDFDPGDAVSPKFIFVFNYLTAPPSRQLQATRSSSYMFIYVSVLDKACLAKDLDMQK